MYVDEVLVYRGQLLPSPPHESLPVAEKPASSTDDHLDWGSRTRPRLRQSLLFTRNAAIIRKEALRIPRVSSEICFFDEGVILLAADAAAEREEDELGGDRPAVRRERGGSDSSNPVARPRTTVTGRRRARPRPSADV